MDRITVTTLVDNNIYDKRTRSEFGFSLLIDYKKEKRFMFDTGFSNIFLYNARKLAIDLNTITDVILSHRHKSHTGGTPHLIRILKAKSRFLVENNYINTFLKNVDGKIVNSYIDYNDKISLFLKRRSATFIKSHYIYQKDIHFFKTEDIDENSYTLNKQNIKNGLVMVINSKKGLILFIGAQYGNFDKILPMINEIFPNTDIFQVFGGFNINFKDQNRVENYKNILKSVNINHIELSHCSSEEVYHFFNDLDIDTNFNGAGKILRFNNIV